MLMLALGMEKPIEGTVEVEFDGENTRIVPAANLAPGTFAYVPQGNMLMSGTVRDKGSGLSEGQMQRLACARAVYSGAPVLLLDECTSALDPATEREMLNRLRALGRTVIIVTHRPAALNICDRTIKLEG